MLHSSFWSIFWLTRTVWQPSQHFTSNHLLLLTSGHNYPWAWAVQTCQIHQQSTSCWSEAGDLGGCRGNPQHKQTRFVFLGYSHFQVQRCILKLAHPCSDKDCFIFQQMASLLSGTWGTSLVQHGRSLKKWLKDWRGQQQGKNKETHDLAICWFMCSK